MHDYQQLSQQFINWYARPPGKYLASVETRQLARILPSLFGFYLLHLGEAQLDANLEASPILEKINFCRSGKMRNGRSIMQGDYQHLPFHSDSLDVVILSHVLEFEQNPEQVLHEAWRVLMPEGHLIIIGFNLYSLWGLWQKVEQLTQHQLDVPWSGQFLSPSIIQHQLFQLGCECLESESYFFRPPIASDNYLKKLRFLEIMGKFCWSQLGGIYILVARKQLLTLTPIKPRWRWITMAQTKGVVVPTSLGRTTRSNLRDE